MVASLQSRPPLFPARNCQYKSLATRSLLANLRILWAKICTAADRFLSLFTTIDNGGSSGIFGMVKVPYFYVQLTAAFNDIFYFKNKRIGSNPHPLGITGQTSTRYTTR
jgi:hypothetical protein